MRKVQRTFELVITPEFCSEWERAKKEAKGTGLSVSEFLREAIRKALREENSA